MTPMPVNMAFCRSLRRGMGMRDVWAISAGLSLGNHASHFAQRGGYLVDSLPGRTLPRARHRPRGIPESNVADASSAWS